MNYYSDREMLCLMAHYLCITLQQVTDLTQEICIQYTPLFSYYEQRFSKSASFQTQLFKPMQIWASILSHICCAWRTLPPTPAQVNKAKCLIMQHSPKLSLSVLCQLHSNLEGFYAFIFSGLLDSPSTSLSIHSFCDC